MIDNVPNSVAHPLVVSFLVSILDRMGVEDSMSVEIEILWGSRLRSLFFSLRRTSYEGKGEQEAPRLASVYAH